MHFTAPSDAALSGRIPRLHAISTGIERAFDAAKYGAFADRTLDRAHHPVDCRSDAGAGGRACECLRVLRYAPYVRAAHLDAERDRLAIARDATIAANAPGFESSIVARTVVTPLDLERTYGMTGGHIFHGELSLDQWFVTRPLLGWARYRTPIDRLYLCGSGTHPGTGLDGRSGANAAREILRDLKR
jgi:phytoene dehydrogenase-like protein